MKYVVEHMEEKWGKWCELEYRHMRQIVGDKPGEECSNAGKKDELWFTNVTSDQRNDFERSLWADLKLDSKEARAVLHTASLEQMQQGKCADVKMDWKNVCLLDMEATEELKPSDVELFDHIVLGGILGNVHVDEQEDGTSKYSSDDRTSEIRDQFVHRRHLGALQMTTDTALLVAHKILHDGHTLSSIPWVDEPEITNDMEIAPSAENNTNNATVDGENDAENDDEDDFACCECVEMTGFRYVGRRCPKSGEWMPTLPPGMAEYLIESNNDDLGDELFFGAGSEDN